MTSLCFRLNIIIICYVRFIKVDFLIMAWLSNEFAVAFVTEYIINLIWKFQLSSKFIVHVLF